MKPHGRLCVIEKYPLIASQDNHHGTLLSSLIVEAEAAGWILKHYELIQSTDSYLAIFVRKNSVAVEASKE